MEKDKRVQSFSSIGLGTLLTIIFMILKLCKVIDWDWIFVFLPIIISFSLYFLIVLIITFIYYKR